MKKEQLRASFARIQPREALVQATLDRIYEQRQRADASAAKRQSLGFATRLATAACALLLVIGVGVMAARNGLMPSDAVVASDDERTAPVTDEMPAQDEAGIGAHSVLVGCEDMIAAARGYGSDWAVGSATVEGVYLAEGMVTLRMTAVADHAASEGAAWSEGESLMAYFDVSDEQLCMLMTDMGDVLVGLHTEQRGGETVWVIHEAYAEAAATE